MVSSSCSRASRSISAGSASRRCSSNANGSITFGRADGAFSETTLAHLNGPPRIAGLWDDLNAAAGGSVTSKKPQTASPCAGRACPNSPPWARTRSPSRSTGRICSASILGAVAGNPFSITYGTLSAADGLAGYSCGGGLTSGFEKESDLSAFRGSIGGLISVPAIFEDLVGTSATETVDLRGTLRFNGVNRIVDLTEIRRNDSIARATPLLHLPFDSANPVFATVIEAERDDVDFYSFRVRAGDVLAIEVVRGNLDSVIGVFDADTGELLVTDDDGGQRPAVTPAAPGRHRPPAGGRSVDLPGSDVRRRWRHATDATRCTSTSTAARRSPSATTTRCRSRWPGRSISRARRATRCS